MNFQNSDSVFKWLGTDAMACIAKIFAILNMLTSPTDIVVFGVTIGLSQPQATAATRQSLQEQFSRWIDSGKTLGELIDLMTVKLNKSSLFFEQFKELAHLRVLTATDQIFGWLQTDPNAVNALLDMVVGSDKKTNFGVGIGMNVNSASQGSDEDFRKAFLRWAENGGTFGELTLLFRQILRVSAPFNSTFPFLRNITDATSMTNREKSYVAQMPVFSSGSNSSSNNNIASASASVGVASVLNLQQQQQANPMTLATKSSNLMTLDEEETVLTLGTLLSVANNPVLTNIESALNAGNSWKQFLSHNRPAVPKVQLALLDILGEVEQEQKQSNHLYNPSHRVIEKLCIAKKFHSMPVTEFLQTFVVPVNVALAAAANAILADLQRVSGETLEKAQEQVQETQNWTNMIDSLKLQLRPGMSRKQVIENLNLLGAPSAEDMEFATAEDLEKCGILLLSARKALSKLKAAAASAGSNNTAVTVVVSSAIPRAPASPTSNMED